MFVSRSSQLLWFFCASIFLTLLLGAALSAYGQQSTCQSGQYIPFGSGAILYNNDWGDSSRGQCVRILDYNNLSWEVTWNSGIGAQYNYPSIVFGNHGWNLSSGDRRFPIQLKDIKTFNSKWTATTTFADNDNGNIAYDLWLSADAGNGGRHDLELMVWLNKWRQFPRGGAAAYTNVLIAGDLYDIYLAANPATITFVRVSETDSVPLLRLKHFVNFVKRSNYMNSQLGVDVTKNWYLHGVEAGFEYKNTNTYNNQYWARTESFLLRLIPHE